MPNKMQILTFENLAKRVLYRYAFAFSDFVPIATDKVSIDAQRQFYELCRSIVSVLADNPKALSLSTEHPDEWLDAGMVLNMRPELYKVRNECQKTFIELSRLLYAAGIHGKLHKNRLSTPISVLPKLTGKKLSVFIKYLEQFGFTICENNESLSFEYIQNPEIFTTWQILAAMCSKKPKNQETMFMLWHHHNEYMFFFDRLKKLLGLDNEFFEYVDKSYQNKGYRIEFGVDEYTVNCWYSKDIGGLLIAFSTLAPTVMFSSLSCIGIKAILEHAEELQAGIKEQLISFCKLCNNCKNCTKNGKNKQFTIIVNHNGKNHSLCPEFVHMRWYNDDISKEKIDFLLEFNELQEKFGKNWKKK
jgi:hypothetical protein